MAGRAKDREHRLPSALVRNPSEAPRAIRGLVSAKLMAKEYPKTFTLPSDMDIKRVKPGGFVQVNRNNERFWVRVTGWVGKKWHGTVANELGNNDDLPRGASIYFTKKNIYNVMSQSEMSRLRRNPGFG